VARGEHLNLDTIRKQPLLKNHPGFAALMAEAESAARAQVAGAPVGRRVSTGPRPTPAPRKFDVRLARATALSALGLARAWARNGKPDEAMATLERARALFDELARERPGDASVARGRAELKRHSVAALGTLELGCLKAGKTDEASGYRKRADALFDQLCSTRPGDPGSAAVRVGALLDRAAFLREAGRWGVAQPAYTRAVDEAVADFARELELLPEGRNHDSPRSRRALNLASWTQAYDRLLELRPDDGHLRTVRGRYHALRGHWDQAAADFARGVPSAPSNSDEWFEHACLRLIVGD